MCFKLDGTIVILSGKSLKLVDQYAYLVSNISSTESNYYISQAKAWAAIDMLVIK